MLIQDRELTSLKEIHKYRSMSIFVGIHTDRLYNFIMHQKNIAC